MRPAPLVLLAGPLLLAAVPRGVCAEAKKDNPDLVLLKKHGITPDPQGLIAYLRSLRSENAARAHLDQLITQLGHDEFTVREAAQQRLGRLALLALPELEAAANHADPEVRMRIRTVLARVETEGKPVLTAVLRTIEDTHPAGIAPELLRVLPGLGDEYLRHLLQETLWRSVTPADAEVMHRALKSDNVLVRAVALPAYARAVGSKVVAEARPFLKAREEQMRLGAVRALLPYEPRSCLEVAVELLQAESLEVRTDAGTLLRAVTGQRFGYAPYATRSIREAAVARWRSWVRAHGQSAKLRPLPAQEPRRSRILLCLLNPSVIKELDIHGKTIFTTQTNNTACGCQGLADGSRVFSDWNTHQVFLLNSHGQEQWRVGVPGTPNSLDHLANGHSLVGLFSEKKVVEIDARGKVVWSIDVDGQPTDTRRLTNGRTLIALYGTNRVIEVDPTGKVLWKIEKIESPESARRLENGNTLIASSHGVVLEYNHEGKVVWSSKNLGRAYDALELENGNILVGHLSGLREINREGTVIRDLPMQSVRRISIY